MAKIPGRHPPRLSERQIAELHQAVNRARHRFMPTTSFSGQQDVTRAASVASRTAPAGALESSPLHETTRVPLLVDRRQR